MGKGLRRVMAVAGLLGLMSSAASAAERATSFEAFRAQVAQGIKKAYPGARVLLLERDGLSVALPDDEPTNQSLVRAWTFYSDDPAHGDEIVRDVVESFAPVVPTPRNILVLVRPAAAFPGGGNARMVRPIGAGLVAVVAVDGPAAYRFPYAADLPGRLHMDVAAIWTQAMSNTRAKTGVAAHPLQPGRPVEISLSNGLSSSLLADDTLWNSPELTSGGPVVVAPLARDVLYLALLSDTQLVRRMRAMMVKVAGDPNNLAEGLIVRRNGRWEPLP